MIDKRPKCRTCKNRFVPLFGNMNQKHCLDNDECVKGQVELAKKQYKKDWNKEKKKIKERLMSVQELMKITQVVFNTYIRERDKGLPCISCQNPDMKKINACHYYSSGGHKNLTFNEDNCFSGCEYCNTYLHGNLIEYRKHLIKRIGIDRVEWLDDNAHVTRKYTRDELRDLIAEYKQKTKELKNKCK